MWLTDNKCQSEELSVHLVQCRQSRQQLQLLLLMFVPRIYQSLSVRSHRRAKTQRRCSPWTNKQILYMEKWCVSVIKCWWQPWNSLMDFPSGIGVVMNFVDLNFNDMENCFMLRSSTSSDFSSLNQRMKAFSSFYKLFEITANISEIIKKKSKLCCWDWC